MRKLVILLVMGLGFITFELRGQTIIVSRPARFVSPVPRLAPVKIVVPARSFVVSGPKIIVTRPPVFVYRPASPRTVIHRTVIYR